MFSFQLLFCNFWISAQLHILQLSYFLVSSGVLVETQQFGPSEDRCSCSTLLFLTLVPQLHRNLGLGFP